MKTFVNFARTLVCVTGLVAASIASAVQIDNIYFFGSSTADMGNNVAGGAPMGGHTVYAIPLAKELGFTLKRSLDPGGTNYAHAGSSLTANTGLLAQINNLPATVSPNALYIIGSGSIYNSLTAAAAPMTVANALNHAKTAITTLQQKGAKYIIIATVPERPTDNPANLLIVQQFNTALKTANAKFVTVDYQGLNEWLTANYAKLGFAAITDLVHMAWAPPTPTNAGHKVLSDYYLSVIKSASFNATLAEIPTSLMQSHNDTVLGQVANGHTLNLENSKVRAFVYGSYIPRISSSVNKSRVDNKYRGYNATVGFIAPINDAHSVGIALAHSNGKTKLKQDAGQFKLTSNTISVFGDSSFGDANISAVLSYGKLNFKNIDRNVPLTGNNNKIFVLNAKGETKGDQIGAMVQGKYTVFADSNYETGPIAQIAYNQTKVKGYTETDAQMANMKFDKQRYKTLSAGLGWHVKYSFANAVLANAKLLVNKQFLSNNRDINLQVVSSGNQSFGVLPVKGTKATSVAADFSIQKDFGTVAANIGYSFEVGNKKLGRHGIKLGLLF